MAKTDTRSIPDMAGSPADGTEFRYRVVDNQVVLTAVDAWDKYQTDVTDNYAGNANAWQTSNPILRPPAHCAVADRDNITDPEKTFIEGRFVDVDESDPTNRSKKGTINASYRQVNATNIPTLAGGDLALLLKCFNALRATLGMNPT